MQFADRQCGNKVFYLIRCNHKQAIGFSPVTGDLGQELVRRHTGRDSDMQGTGNASADILGDARGTARIPLAVAHIQVGLVQRQRFDQLGVVAEDRVDFPRGLTVGLEARLDDQQVGTQLQRMPRRHGRAHTVGTRFIVAGGNHPAMVGRASHRHGPTGQARVVTHLDCGVEAIAVDVDDLAQGHG
ncbi:hypothetical protein D9M71_530520 [compost metagenome]